MSSEPLRLLCTGDLHLGRHPSRIPVYERELSVDAVWQATVDYAENQQVDGVILSGDVVDWDNRFYEAFGPLLKGLNQLFSAGIDVYAVAGNHDFDVLPRLMEGIESEQFHFLGRRGEWSAAPVTKDGRTAALIAGWSFPQNMVSHSPLDGFEVLPSDLPLIGVLHGDMDQQGGNYAPFKRGELVGTGALAWVLGHIHAPGLVEEAGMPILYVGSLQPLDPGEPGQHGPWLLEINSAGSVECRQVPLANLRYERLLVDISEVTDEPSFRTVITDAITRDLTEQGKGNIHLKRVVYRIELRGRSGIQPELERFCLKLRDSGLEVPVRHVTGVVDDFTINTRPAYDLPALAGQADPPGVLAQLLIDLEAGVPLDEYRTLVQSIKQSAADIERANAFQPLRREGDSLEIDAEEMCRLIAQQATKLLDELMSQKEESSTHG